MRREATARIDPARLGERLAAARRARGFSQEEVARLLGVSRPTLVSIEKGTRMARAAEVSALADLFGCSVHELVAGRQFVADFAPQFRLTQARDVPPEAVEKAVRDFQALCEDYLTLE